MIIMKIVRGSAADNIAIVAGGHGVAEADKTITNDTFSLHSNYPDPFRYKRQSPGIAAVTHKEIQPHKQPQVKTVSSEWPSIVYGGIIRNQSSKKELALVQLNGQSHMMSVGEKSGEIQLIRITRDSVLVKLGKESKYFRK
jgi:type II secretory pathway component PulC